MSILLECKDLYILQEAYYGKPKEFIEIEKRLEKIIDMIKLTMTNPDKAVDINGMKEVAEIERIFTKFFKVYDTSITFYSTFDILRTAKLIDITTQDTNLYDTVRNNVPLSPSFNAFTFPSSLSYFKKDPRNPKLSKPDDLFINVNMDIGLIYNLDLNAKEVMGFILHEIGHCFDASLFALLSNIQIVFNPKSLQPNLIGTLYTTFINFLLYSVPVIGVFFQQMNRFISQNPTLNKWMNDINVILHDTFVLISLRNILGSFNPLAYILQLANPGNLFGYGGEKFADSFAASYGYGKDLSSGLYKMRMGKHSKVITEISKIPVLNIGYDLTSVYIRMISLHGDPHPNEVARMQSQLNKLKRDLKDPTLSPKVKKELLINIKEIEDYIDNTVLNKDAEDNHGKWVSMFMNYLIIKVFDGKIDPRELFEAIHKHEL